MPPLRIALTLPGEASLGTFQAGAVAALIVAAQRINALDPGALRVDAMTCASSGSLTAVLAARSLLAGSDPVVPLRRAWVSEPTLDALMGRDRSAPLTLRRAAEVARELLAQPLPALEGGAAQTANVELEFALATLRGFTYELSRGADGQAGSESRDPLRATSHLDWSRHVLGPEDRQGFTSRWSGAIDAAIASASHPAAFPPALLDRTGQELAYERNGVVDFPECPELWYADGGLVDREPLGRCIKLVRGIDGGPDHARWSHRPDPEVDPRRVVVLIRPEPDAGVAADDPAWTRDGGRPAWATTLGRAFKIMVTHSLHEDLRRLEKTNDRVAWTQKLCELLATHLDSTAAEQELRRLAEEIDEDKQRRSSRPQERRTELPAELGPLIEYVVSEAAGLTAKSTVRVEIVSAAERELAGGSLLSFGGFLAERLRASDFLVGYGAMLNWLEANLQGAGVGAHDAELACQAVRARATTVPGWVTGAGGGRRTSIRRSVDVLRIGVRAASIGLRGGDGRGRS